MTSLQIFSIDGVKNSVLASSVIDNEFESRLGQDYKIGICCISTKHVGLINTKIAYPSGAPDISSGFK
jgi:hypothetical protein